MKVGKCPKCDALLTTEDIERITLIFRLGDNYAFVCKKCSYIIGFGVKAIVYA